jgi:preprotein translocase subunit SecY
LIRALYGQAQALPASLFNLGISPYINASIVITVLLVLPAEIFTFQWLARLKEARKEGKSVSSLFV